jgi:hypothetical protein
MYRFIIFWVPKALEEGLNDLPHFDQFFDKGYDLNVYEK